MNILKRVGTAIIACATVASMFAAVPANAATVNEAVLKHTPRLDGKLDAAYLQSYYINHEWPAEKNSSNYWGCGKFEFIDREKNADGTYVDGSVGYNTAYGWDLQATSYFLWDDDYIYIAVNVTDDDYGCIDDKHYAMAAADTGNVSSWLQDAINVQLIYKGMGFTIRADRAGRYVSVFREPNYGEQVWCDMYSWIEHQRNKEAGYFATSETGSGYLIEIRVPVSESVKAKILKDGGNFKYGISIADSPVNAEYGLDQAKLADGIEEEGYNFIDFMLHNDLNPVDNKADYKVKLKDQAPEIDESEDAASNSAINDSNVGGNTTAPGTAGGTTGAGSAGGSSTSDPSAPTGDIGVAVAATALVAGACFIAIKKRK